MTDNTEEQQAGPSSSLPTALSFGEVGPAYSADDLSEEAKASRRIHSLEVANRAVELDINRLRRIAKQFLAAKVASSCPRTIPSIDEYLKCFDILKKNKDKTFCNNATEYITDYVDEHIDDPATDEMRVNLGLSAPDFQPETAGESNIHPYTAAQNAVNDAKQKQRLRRPSKLPSRGVPSDATGSELNARREEAIRADKEKHIAASVFRSTPIMKTRLIPQPKTTKRSRQLEAVLAEAIREAAMAEKEKKEEDERKTMPAPRAVPTSTNKERLKDMKMTIAAELLLKRKKSEKIAKAEKPEGPKLSALERLRKSQQIFASNPEAGPSTSTASTKLRQAKIKEVIANLAPKAPAPKRTIRRPTAGPSIPGPSTSTASTRLRQAKIKEIIANLAPSGPAPKRTIRPPTARTARSVPPPPPRQRPTTPARSASAIRPPTASGLRPPTARRAPSTQRQNRSEELRRIAIREISKSRNSRLASLKQPAPKQERTSPEEARRRMQAPAPVNSAMRETTSSRLRDRRIKRVLQALKPAVRLPTKRILDEGDGVLLHSGVCPGECGTQKCFSMGDYSGSVQIVNREARDRSERCGRAVQALGELKADKELLQKLHHHCRGVLKQKYKLEKQISEMYPEVFDFLNDDVLDLNPNLSPVVSVFVQAFSDMKRDPLNYCDEERMEQIQTELFREVCPDPSAAVAAEYINDLPLAEAAEVLDEIAAEDPTAAAEILEEIANEGPSEGAQVINEIANELPAAQEELLNEIIDELPVDEAEVIIDELAGFDPDFEIDDEMEGFSLNNRLAGYIKKYTGVGEQPAPEVDEPLEEVDEPLQEAPTAPEESPINQRQADRNAKLQDFFASLGSYVKPAAAPQPSPEVEEEEAEAEQPRPPYAGVLRGRYPGPRDFTYDEEPRDHYTEGVRFYHDEVTGRRQMDPSSVGAFISALRANQGPNPAPLVPPGEGGSAAVEPVEELGYAGGAAIQYYLNKFAHRQRDRN